MDNQKVIATLNNLLETTKDGARGFRTCAEGISNPRLSTVFEAAARRCDEGAGELEAKIHSLGGEPAASGTVGVRFIAPGPILDLLHNLVLTKG
jgi:uncharacterized protein (TIGR02284 family)